MTRTSTVLGASAALALGLVLSACSGAEPGDATPTVTVTEPATSSPADSSDAATSSSDDDSATASPSSTASSTAGDDRTASGLAAIATAEAEAGGVAYAIDSEDDDGGWEVSVRTGDTAVEVRIGADGSVLRTEPDDLDADDRQALDAVSITLVQAIEAAVAETGGTLDDADLSDDDSRHVEVTVDTADRDDVDVHLDPATGDVLRVE